MKVFDTANLDERLMKSLSADEAACIYNGLDVCVTAEIFNELSKQLADEPENVRETYHTSLAKLAPIMEMSMRGMHVDEEARQTSIKELSRDLAELDKKFQHIMTEVFEMELNWNSPTQLKSFFYTILGLKEIKKRNAKGIFAPTVNAEALEQLKKYLYARPFCNFILLLRDLAKQISFLKSEVDPDQRLRTSYNIAGTNTGRLASSMNDFGSGTNVQNVNRKLRYPFDADAGMYLLNIDLEQADGRNVGAICWNAFHDMERKDIAKYLKLNEWIGPEGPTFAGSYLDACESGDLHTFVCRMTWPELDWPEDPKKWKKYCDSVILFGQDSYRQGAKKLGHGTNYYGTPRTMAKHAHVPTVVIENFQTRYFGQFPCIPAWHNWTIEQIVETGTLTTPFGRRRMFFGRANDPSTWRKAIAYSPQSMTGEEIDRGLLSLWRKYPQIQLLNQVHDSVLLQLPFSEATDLVPLVLDALTVELTLKGDRKFSVPLEAAGGWNWGYVQYWDKEDYENNRCAEDRIGKPKSNLHGLSKWTGQELRERPNPHRRLKDFLHCAPTG